MPPACPENDGVPANDVTQTATAVMEDEPVVPTRTPSSVDIAGALPMPTFVIAEAAVAPIAPPEPVLNVPAGHDELWLTVPVPAERDDVT